MFILKISLWYRVRAAMLEPKPGPQKTAQLVGGLSQDSSSEQQWSNNSATHTQMHEKSSLLAQNRCSLGGVRFPFVLYFRIKWCVHGVHLRPTHFNHFDYVNFIYLWLGDGMEYNARALMLCNSRDKTKQDAQPNRLQFENTVARLYLPPFQCTAADLNFEPIVAPPFQCVFSGAVVVVVLSAPKLLL